MSNTLSIRPNDKKDVFTLGFPNQLLEEMQALHDEIARTAFGYFEKRGGADGSAMDDWLRAETELLEPVQLSMKDGKDRITVTAEVPGFSMDQLKVHVDGRDLKFCGKSEKTAKSGKDETSSQRHICCHVTLPTDVTAQEATARLDNGVLILDLPKSKPAKELEVKAAA